MNPQDQNDTGPRNGLAKGGLADMFSIRVQSQSAEPNVIARIIHEAGSTANDLLSFIANLKLQSAKVKMKVTLATQRTGGGPLRGNFQFAIYTLHFALCNP